LAKAQEKSTAETMEAKRKWYDAEAEERQSQLNSN